MNPGQGVEIASLVVIVVKTSEDQNLPNAAKNLLELVNPQCVLETVSRSQSN